MRAPRVYPDSHARADRMTSLDSTSGPDWSWTHRRIHTEHQCCSDDLHFDLPLRPAHQPRSITTNAALETAIQKVLHLPELLETILLSLSQKELLLSQRVSRAFRATITGSLRLQKALFFAPDWKLEGRTFNAYAKNNRPGKKPENNRLLLRAFPNNYPTVTLVIMNDNDHGPSEEDLIAGRSGSEHWSWDVCISFPADRPPSTSTSPAVLYPEASWRRMFLSQPPCTSLHLVRRWQRSLNPAIVREEGIRMGEFVDTATETRTSGVWHSSYISSDRDWHFEGNIKCSRLMEDVDLEKTKAEEFTARLREYLFSSGQVAAA